MLSQFQHSFIEIEVSDRAPGIKQKARWLSMTPSQHPETGEVRVLVNVLVTLYQDDNGRYGPVLNSHGISQYSVTLVADNNTAVVPMTGEVLLMRGLESDAQWLALLDADPRQLLRQGDFFELLISYSPLAIGEMLEDFMRQADAAPFTKFQPAA